jgi:hypothetical protein
MEVYFAKDIQQATTDITATHATVKQMARIEKGCGQKSHMDNYFSSPDLYDNLTELDINCCGTVSPNHKGMPDDLTFRHPSFTIKFLHILYVKCE